jgi:hypothetical protein
MQNPTTVTHWITDRQVMAAILKKNIWKPDFFCPFLELFDNLKTVPKFF